MSEELPYIEGVRREPEDLYFVLRGRGCGGCCETSLLVRTDPRLGRKPKPWDMLRMAARRCLDHAYMKHELAFVEVEYETEPFKPRITAAIRANEIEDDKEWGKFTEHLKNQMGI